MCVTGWWWISGWVGDRYVFWGIGVAGSEDFLLKFLVLAAGRIAF